MNWMINDIRRTFSKIKRDEIAASLIHAARMQNDPSGQKKVLIESIGMYDIFFDETSGQATIDCVCVTEEDGTYSDTAANLAKALSAE